MRLIFKLTRMLGDVDGGRGSGEDWQLVSGGVQLQLKVGRGSLHQNSLEHVGVDSLQEDRVG